MVYPLTPPIRAPSRDSPITHKQIKPDRFLIKDVTFIPTPKKPTVSLYLVTRATHPQDITPTAELSVDNNKLALHCGKHFKRAGRRTAPPLAAPRRTRPCCLGYLPRNTAQKSNIGKLGNGPVWTVAFESVFKACSEPRRIQVLHIAWRFLRSRRRSVP